MSATKTLTSRGRIHNRVSYGITSALPSKITPPFFLAKQSPGLFYSSADSPNAIQPPHTHRSSTTPFPPYTQRTYQNNLHTTLITPLPHILLSTKLIPAHTHTLTRYTTSTTPQSLSGKRQPTITPQFPNGTHTCTSSHTRLKPLPKRCHQLAATTPPNDTLTCTIVYTQPQLLPTERQQPINTHLATDLPACKTLYSRPRSSLAETQQLAHMPPITAPHTCMIYHPRPKLSLREQQ